MMRHMHIENWIHKSYLHSSLLQRENSGVILKKNSEAFSSMESKEIDAFFEKLSELGIDDGSCSLSEPRDDKILKALNDLENVFSEHPADVDHPEKRAAVHEAVQLISAMNQSKVLTDRQIERVSHLVTNWSAVVDQAVAANRTKQEAQERLSPLDPTAASLQDLVSKEKYLKEEHNKLDHESHELRRQIEELRGRSDDVRRKIDKVKKEREMTIAMAKELKEEHNQLKVEAPKLKQSLMKATQSVARAQTEWVALKNMLDEVSVIFADQ